MSASVLVTAVAAGTAAAAVAVGEVDVYAAAVCEEGVATGAVVDLRVWLAAGRWESTPEIE